MGIPNYPEKVFGRNLVFPNIWSRSSHTRRNELVQCSSFKIQSRREFRVEDETVEHAGRMSRISDYTTGKISTKTCPEIQQGCEEKGVWSKRFGTSKGNREYTGRQCREVSTNLAKAYYLEDLDKRPLPRPWNAHNLKKFYH